MKELAELIALILQRLFKLNCTNDEILEITEKLPTEIKSLVEKKKFVPFGIKLATFLIRKYLPENKKIDLNNIDLTENGGKNGKN